MVPSTCERPVSRPTPSLTGVTQTARTDIGWTITDIFLIVLVGLMGAFMVGGIGIGLGVSQTALLLMSTAGMALAHTFAVWHVLRRRNRSFTEMGLRTQLADGWFLALGMVLQVALALLALPFLELIGPDQSTTQVVVEEAAKVSDLGSRIGVFVLAGFLGPAAEELVFRGALLQLAERRFRPPIANLVTATIFSLVHIFGIEPGNPWASAVTLVLLFMVGLVLGALTQRHNRLGPAIFTHAGFNLASLLLLYAAPQLTG